MADVAMVDGRRRRWLVIDSRCCDGRWSMAVGRRKRWLVINGHRNIKIETGHRVLRPSQHQPKNTNQEVITMGYLAALFIGFILGLIGGGGSILTIPVLVYLFSFSPTLAISYSLFIVGFTSLVGAYNNYRKGQVNFKTALLFGGLSILTVFITRKFIIPLLPDVFFTIRGFSVTHSMFVMVVFAILMLTASVSMIRGNRQRPFQRHARKNTTGIIIMYSMMIGLITGFLGAGGGFLLIPALVVLLKLPMKQAIGTSLLIISMNCLVGFAGDFGRHPINWNFMFYFTALAIGGIFAGGWLNNKVNSEKLRKIFGWFVLVMGLFVLAEEILF